ncbi:polysaccharide lyase family 1 protein [Candidatus Symbiopectobacterium sp. NZEC135]|uniref:pectate lyase family protein n=1 Tax=Candidatus Symbiopectobacterium sp. NZEC135 TaxID=2820471 RepID=UPI002227C2B4|nr:polysaccharide lyase family 1 protein [Candidatus Symbiopectobacterium sp. NZEC135]MCW2477674.1 polysaccharide lyase family 1 protein [Candidatus Symbiopectobacterium sp. NZEC135]
MLVKNSRRFRYSVLCVALSSLFLSGCDNSSSHTELTNDTLPVKTAPFGWTAQYKDVDGTAAATTGGEGARAESIYVVSSRQELKDALSNVRSPNYLAGDAAAELAAKLEPKIIYWVGTIRGDDLGNGTYADATYYKTKPNKTTFDFDLYVKAFDTDYMAQLQATINAGGAEAAAAQTELTLLKKQNGQRSQYANNQKAQIQFQVPPNTTILGVGQDAKLEEGYLSINTLSHTFNKTDNSNIIIRNITFQAPRDFAPAWDASDGASGNWNARYDAVSINASKNVWIDHCTFTDGEHPDSKEQVLFGKHIQRHDGLLDIEDGADYLTISYNVFEEHDKTTIIGSGDGDKGEYRITFEGNLWSNLTQRAPRVRFGQVHLVNNYHRGASDADYPILYSIGMGFASSILSEGNVFNFQGAGAEESTIIGAYKGSKFKDNGSWFNGAQAKNLNQIAIEKCTALQEQEKAAAESAGKVPGDWALETCTNEIGWEPPYTYAVGKSIAAVEKYVLENAGAGKLSISLPD